MIPRKELITETTLALQANPVTALLGPRQCGKTTLAGMIGQETESVYFDLEDPGDILKLTNPKMMLQDQKGLIILDEIQRKPDLFPILRVLSDQPDFKGKFLILGSASPRLVKGVSETLAGRVAFVGIGGFGLKEIGTEQFERLWLRGGFPRSFLAESDNLSFKWRNDFIRTFLERDIPQLGISVPAMTLRRFWTMVAHYHGNIWNASELARSMGSSEATMRRYLDILSGTFLLRPLQPWHANLRKRQVKSPKIYFRDSGLLHTLLSIQSREGLLGHPKYGASWEGFAIEQILKVLQPTDAYFWATHTGAELDLLIFVDGRAFGFECKCSDAPGITRSMRTALHDLSLCRLFIIYPGNDSFPLDDLIQVVSVSKLEQIRADCIY
ncbi:MAG: ATP-binding protein [Desulfobacterales bacterium]|nr:ATP-binding protein [Desulfobacterales bacterium]